MKTKETNKNKPKTKRTHTSNTTLCLCLACVPLSLSLLHTINVNNLTLPIAASASLSQKTTFCLRATAHNTPHTRLCLRHCPAFLCVSVRLSLPALQFFTAFACLSQNSAFGFVLLCVSISQRDSIANQRSNPLASSVWPWLSCRFI